MIRRIGWLNSVVWLFASVCVVLSFLGCSSGIHCKTDADCGDITLKCVTSQSMCFSKGEQGAKGADGKNGTNGNDGKSCSITNQEKDKDGNTVLTFSCTADKVTIPSGKDGQVGANGKDGQAGAKGDPGKDGESCVLKGQRKDGWDTVITFTCGSKDMDVRIPGEPPAGAEQTVTGLTATAKVVYIPPGKFLMGSPVTEPGRTLNETQHLVTLTKGFWMWQTEVTQGQFNELMNYNPSTFIGCGVNCPVEQVNWHEAVAFANALSKKQGLSECFDCKLTNANDPKSYDCTLKTAYQGNNGQDYYKCPGWRLPTESEWEYAARAGTTTALYSGPIEIKNTYNAPALDAISWYGGNSGVSYSRGDSVCNGWPDKQYPATMCGTHQVAQKVPNAWGLYDMLGNVWERCYDWDGGNYPNGAVVDPVGASTGNNRVDRGGAWDHSAADVRVSRHAFSPPSYRGYAVGFRAVRTGS